MTTRVGWLLLAATVAGCAGSGAGGLPATVQGAATNYPPLILGGTVRATSGGEQPLACAAPGSRVEQKGGPTIEFEGADPSDPTLCVMKVAGGTVKAWYDIWLTDWPGAAEARTALRDVIQGPSGTVTGFDTRMLPGLQWHDLIRNEGVEDLTLLGKTYHALKISHYREGSEGNNYRSVATVWKDIPTGMLIYATYQHISGKPEIDDPLIPTAIVAAK